MEVAAYSVPGWLRYAEEQGFYVFQVPDSADPKNGEAVPFALVFVLRVTQQPPVEVCCESDIIKLVPFVQNIDSCIVTHDLIEPTSK